MECHCATYIGLPDSHDVIKFIEVQWYPDPNFTNNVIIAEVVQANLFMDRII